MSAAAVAVVWDGTPGGSDNTWRRTAAAAAAAAAAVVVVVVVRWQALRPPGLLQQPHQAEPFPALLREAPHQHLHLRVVVARRRRQHALVELLHR